RATEVTIPTQIDEESLCRVVIACCDQRAQISARSPGGRGIQKQRVGGLRGVRGQSGQRVNRWNEVSNGAVAIERDAAPRCWDIAPFGNIPCRAQGPFAGPVLVWIAACRGAARAAQ